MISINNKYSQNRFILLISLFAVIQFIVITLIAGFFYPINYSITGNYFSDLGMVHVDNQLNPIASTLFMIALFMIIIGLFPYWFLLVKIFSKNKIENVLSIVGSIMGVCSSLALTIVALNPVDTELNTHIFFAGIFFVCFGIFILAYSINFLLNNEVNSSLFIFGLIIFIASLIFDQGTPRIIGIGPFWEKCVGYAYFLWIIIVDIILWKNHT